MSEIYPVSRAIVIGSSGGIGAAIKRALTEKGVFVVGLSRVQSDSGQPFDLTSEASIAAAATRLRDQAPFCSIYVCTGLLHDSVLKPEKALRDIDQAGMMRSFAVNAVGPALVAKHFVPFLPKEGRCVFAALSARVGSISDNRLGGWYGYRASKAALNMIMKTLAIELARTRSEAICVALHPGTVDTDLSRPFQKNVDASRLFSTDQSAANLLRVVDRLSADQSGRCFAWDGCEIAP
jgi:NAD(P)-dependent dehydrogenase (short-subunit alcohol dehydrogenase family)